MAHVTIHNQVPVETPIGKWTLCFQKVTYHYDDGGEEYGYRFIWRRPNGKLQAARGQARIESYEQMQELIEMAKHAGFFKGEM